MHAAVQDLVAGLDHGIHDLFVDQAELAVADGGGLLDVGQAVDQLGMKGQTGDGEVFRAAQGLHAVIYVSGNFLGPDGIFFDTIDAGHFGFLRNGFL